MAWIRSEQSLERHPKTLGLKTILKVELETVIGRLHMLWWWCLDYAINGDLTKHTPEVIEAACHIPLSALIEVKFVDLDPYLRIHDWWDNQGNYLKIKYRDHSEIWREIETQYSTHVLHTGKTVDVRTYGRTEKTYGRTDVEKRDVRASAGLGATPPPAPLAGDLSPEEMEDIRSKAMGRRK